MQTTIIILSIAFVLMLIFGGTSAYLLWKERHETPPINKEIQKLKSELDHSKQNLNESLSKVNDLLSTNANLQAQLNELNVSQVIKSTEQQTLIDAKQETLNQLEDQVRRKTSYLAELEKSFSEKQKILTEQLNNDQEKRLEIVAAKNALDKEMADTTAELGALREEVIKEQKILDELKERSKMAILASKKEENELGIKFVINYKEKSLIQAIDTICNDYPELTRDLRKIEWEKVWRPKIQRYRSELSGVQGIYKITLIEDNDICYIGQARDVYERWFEHMKKMVGMDGKGNERLYEYRIEDFGWKVLEEVEDAGRLNEVEHYWIDYFAGVEVGLNKKI